MSKPIGIWPIYPDFGLELVDIEHGICDVAVIKYLNEGKKHRRRINYDKDRPYITFNYKRWYLDECIKP